VTSADLNLRAGPSTADPVLAVLTRGTVVHILDLAAAEWRRVQGVLTGALGYVSSAFLRPAPAAGDVTPEATLLGAPRATRRELEVLHYRQWRLEDRFSRGRETRERPAR
jgi:hypothetical protein